MPAGDFDNIDKNPGLNDAVVRNPLAKELSAASIRAIADEPSAFFRGEQLTTNTRILNRPVLHQSNPEQQESAHSELGQRALADAFSMRLRHHDSELHRSLAPKFGVASLVFEVLEQLRLESLATESQYARVPGLRGNLQRRFKAWMGDAQNTELLESHAGILLFSLAVAVWARLNAHDIPHEVDGVIEATRAAIGAQAGAALQQLYKHKMSQRAFAEKSLEIADVIQSMLETEPNAAQSGDDDGVEPPELDDALQSALRASGLLPSDPSNLDASTLPTAVAANSGRDITFESADYKVFTREFDREYVASSLLRREKLQLLREGLDGIASQAGINIARYSNELQELLNTPNFGRWNDSEEFGFLNPAQLSGFVGNPNNHSIFRRERSYLNSDCHVTVLLDCSGSMKQHAQSIALLCDLLNRAFGQAGISCEILGFTTNSWNGGKPFKKWLALGRPAGPGRLGEQCHTVYKSAEQSWRKGRHGIAALMRVDLYREGIDGEALEWACKRLENVSQSRRVILVVSDGSPMETGTAKGNDDFYLDRHLQQVARRIESSGDVALCALGVGLDLSPYYRNSLAYDTQRKLSLAHLRDIARLIQRALYSSGANSRP